MTKLLVVGPSWVGDMIMAHPLFTRLHQRDEKLTLDVLAPGWTLPLLERMPEVSRAWENPFVHGELNISARWQLAHRLRDEAYDQAIVLPNSIKSALIPFFARIPRRTGYLGEKRYLLLNDRHTLDKIAIPLMAERFAALAVPAGTPLTRPIPLPTLRANATGYHTTTQKLGITTEQPVAVLCPGAEYGPAKRWPTTYFAALAQWFAHRDYAVWLIGSPKDKSIGDEVHHLSGGVCNNLCGRTTLSEAIDLLAHAALVVTNDSGLMHVTAALDRPLAALFGSSSPAFTPPLSPHARVISIDLACGPCFKRECSLGHFHCMRQLTPERVAADIETWIINQKND